MGIIGRRRSRKQRVAKQVKNLRKRIPSTPELSGKFPTELPNLPSVQELGVSRRISRDSGSNDSPMLSLAGGLLLGLLVGIVVAVLLIARNEEEDASRERQTGITLLSDRGDGDQPSTDESAAVTG